jgi:hypothetical protein
MQKTLIFSLGVGFLAACSSDEPGPKKLEDNSLRTEASFCQEWAEAACNEDVVGNCDETSESACVERQAAFCEDLVPSGYSSVHAADCIEAVGDAYEDAELDADELDVVLRLGGACSQLIAGPDEEGESCGEPNDCDTVHGYTCVIKAGEETGTCQEPQIQGKGEPCDAQAMVCEEGAFCDGENCLVTKSEGDECSYDAMCEDGTRCVIEIDATEGTCEPKLANRDSCTADSECASGICLTSTMTCVAKIVLTAESSLCIDL